MKPLQWVIEKSNGAPGSDQHLAHKLEFALNPPPIFSSVLNWSKERECSLEMFTRAVKERDWAFFCKVGNGFKALKENDLNRSLEPRYFLFLAYDFLSRNRTSKPAKNEVVALGKRIWAIARLTRRTPKLPLPSDEPKLGKKIELEIGALPKQNYTRLLKDLGLDDLPHAKPGPKTTGPIRRR